MPLTLTARSNQLQSGAAPPPLRLDRRGAAIGRAPGNDWTLPDERNTVSSRHCEIAFADGGYVLTDTSTNGTSINGRRLTAPQRLAEGDAIGIGPYTVAVSIAPDVVQSPPMQRTQAPAPGATASPADHLLRAAGVRRADVAGSDADVLAAAGTLLRTMAAGAATLLERRDKARSELGVAAGAANPLARPDGLAQLFATPVAAGQAFADLEGHQLAALKAMQGAMKATLDTLSPAAIRKRAGGKADGAVLWQEYERAFASGDGGFADVFTREFRAAYEALGKRTTQ